MAQIHSGDEFRVFKFKETGIVALCHEVAELHNEGGFPADVDLSSAEYRLDKNGHNIVFKRKS